MNVQTMRRQAHKVLCMEDQRLLVSDDIHKQRAGKWQKLQQYLQLETNKLVYNVLIMGVYYNFSKTHFISHFTDQIDKYRSLPQNSIEDRKSTRLNSSHVSISYAVFCLKKKKKNK